MNLFPVVQHRHPPALVASFAVYGVLDCSYRCCCCDLHTPPPLGPLHTSYSCLDIEDGAKKQIAISATQLLPQVWPCQDSLFGLGASV